MAARELLTDSGSVFVQIGDENVHLVRCLLDEVFGSENFVALIRFRKKTMPLGAKFLERMEDYLVWYAKDCNSVKYRQLLMAKDYSADFHWNNYELPDGERKKLTKQQIETGQQIPKEARMFRLVSLWPASFSSNAVYPVKFRGQEWCPPEGQCYPTSPENMQRLIYANHIEVEGKYLRKVLYAKGAEYGKLTTNWDDTIGARDQNYVVETNPQVIERCLLMTTDPGDLVLDPTCGSGTTAYVAEQWGRRWMTIDTSRVALALARTRLMAAKYPYYLLADSPEGVKKEAELTGKVPEHLRTAGDIKKGFVYQRVPHITLKSIANNVEIDVIYAQYQEQLEALRAQLNELLRQSWEEWDIPRHANDDWSRDTQETLAKWWELRQQRQQAIDAAIARNVDTETLFDQPYEDHKKIRVTGPFTVESLSPHRVLSTDIDQPHSEQAEGAGGDFTALLLDNLRKAGVQNTIKNERLKFDSLDPYSGRWIQAEGRYTEQDGATRRAAISIGPEHGAVSPQQVKEACKEAVQGLGFDVLLVCGLAFDPHVSEEAKRYGTLIVLPVRVNPDLVMGGDLLKKTGSGNLFMIFGEPDLDIRTTRDGKIQVELLGLDIYDPTTGQIRSNSTREIACWFIDTNYNEESFSCATPISPAATNPTTN